MLTQESQLLLNEGLSDMFYRCRFRYKDFNYRIGSLTEYFKLADVEAVWDDLRQMQPKVLAPVELDMLEDNFISSLCRH
ncbi:MAG TPA: hypothetical protein V6D14_24080 [Coleofasciculaceae cyanobacterium]|jgi:hypothetical protein